MLYAGKVIEYFRLLAERSMSRHSLAGERDRAGGPQMLRVNEAQQPAFQPQQSYLRILHTENFCQHGAQVDGRDSLA